MPGISCHRMDRARQVGDSAENGCKLPRWHAAGPATISRQKSAVKMRSDDTEHPGKVFVVAAGEDQQAAPEGKGRFQRSHQSNGRGHIMCTIEYDKRTPAYDLKPGRPLHTR